MDNHALNFLATATAYASNVFVKKPLGASHLRKTRGSLEKLADLFGKYDSEDLEDRVKRKKRSFLEDPGRLFKHLIARGMRKALRDVGIPTDVVLITELHGIPISYRVDAVLNDSLLLLHFSRKEYSRPDVLLKDIEFQASALKWILENGSDVTLGPESWPSGPKVSEEEILEKAKKLRILVFNGLKVDEYVIDVSALELGDFWRFAYGSSNNEYAKNVDIKKDYSYKALLEIYGQLNKKSLEQALKFSGERGVSVYDLALGCPIAYKFKESKVLSVAPPSKEQLIGTAFHNGAFDVLQKAFELYPGNFHYKGNKIGLLNTEKWHKKLFNVRGRTTWLLGRSDVYMVLYNNMTGEHEVRVIEFKAKYSEVPKARVSKWSLEQTKLYLSMIDVPYRKVGEVITFAFNKHFDVDIASAEVLQQYEEEEVVKRLESLLFPELARATEEWKCEICKWKEPCPLREPKR